MTQDALQNNPPPRRKRGPRPLDMRRRLRYGVETALAYFVYGFFAVLPVAAASATGGFLLARLGPRMGISKTARANLLRAFPDKPEKEREDILRGMWDNLGRVIAEYPHLRRIAARCEVEGIEHFEAMRAGGIFFSGHIANWEIYGLLALRHGMRVNLLYRKPNNPWVDGLLRHARGGADVGHITKSDKGAREIFSALRRGEAVAMLMDQKLTEGVPVPFFGTPAQTASAIAQFALKFGCPVVPAAAERLPGARFRVRLYPPIDTSSTGDSNADTQRILTAVNEQLEAWIRAQPAAWLWLHKRWPDVK